MINTFSQKNEKIKILLDTIKSLDLEITPKSVIEKKQTGCNIVWAGKIDTIEIKKINNNVEMLFYCKHYYFDTVSKELICSKQMKLKSYGDGYFVYSIISNEMTLENANKIVRNLYEKSPPYILTIGKVEGFENKSGKKYVKIQSFNFYTFHL